VAVQQLLSTRQEFRQFRRSCHLVYVCATASHTRGYLADNRFVCIRVCVCVCVCGVVDVMDEVGSGIVHSDTPNFRCCPFFNVDQSTSFSVFWAIQDVQPGDTITRDFAYGITDEQQRNARLSIWRDYESPSDIEIPCAPPSHPITSHPVECNSSSTEQPAWSFEQPDDVPSTYPLKIYCDFDLVYSFLTFPEFKCVKQAEEADVVWCNQMLQHSTLLANQVCVPRTREALL
jgi:hypothetical protein